MDGDDLENNHLLDSIVSEDQSIDFDIATSCLNLSYYSLRSDNLNKTLSPDLLALCVNSTSEILRAAADGNFNAISDVIQTNPVNTISAILTISDGDVQRTCIDVYANIIRGLAEQGVDPVAPLNSSMFAAYLEQIECQEIAEKFSDWNAHATFEPEAALDAHGLCSKVLSSSQFGAIRVPDTLGNEAALIRPTAMASIRRRDIISLASTIIADCLSGQQLLGKEYETWLLRTKNEHGLFGAWASNDNRQVKALLATTLQAYRAVECLAKDSRGIVPGVNRRVQTPTFKAPESEIVSAWSTETASEKCVFYCKWLESHMDRFVIADQMQDYSQIVERIKPSVELALTLYLIKVSPNAHKELKVWAKNLAIRLFESISWSGLIEFYRLNPSASLGLLIFPLTARAAGREIPFSKTIEEILDAPYSFAQERSPMRKMDFCFLARLMGAQDKRFHDVEGQLSNTLLGSRSHPLWYSIDGLYDFTHAIFYATDFGLMTTKVNRDLGRWIGEKLPDLVLESVIRDDLDLGGEFVLCSYYLGFSELADHRFAESKFVNALPADRPVSGPGMDFRDGLDEFDSCYHTTLVATIALMEILGSRFSGRFDFRGLEKRKHYQKVDEYSPATEPIEFEGIGGVAKSFSIDVKMIESLGGDERKDKYLIHSEGGRKHFVTRYANAFEWPTIRNSLKLAQKATEFSLAKESGTKTEVHGGSLFVVRDFVPGGALAECERYPVAPITGAFAASFHKKLSSQRGQVLHNHVSSWVNSLNSAIAKRVPSSLVNYFLENLDFPFSVIHGDLNATNLLVSENGEEIFAIDFESVGIGLPEQELSLILVSQYSVAKEMHHARQSLVENYTSHGGMIDEKLLDACIATAPVYIYYISQARNQWDMNTSSFFRQTCLMRIRNSLEAIS